MAKYVKGIDVASWEPNINWEKVCTQDIHFAFIKASQADFTDPLFDSHWAGAKRAGILRGAYHFLDPNVDSRLQAETFLNKVKLEPGDLPPVLDLEELKPQASTAPAPKTGKGAKGAKGDKDKAGAKGSKAGKAAAVPNSRIIGVAADWLMRVEAATGRTPIIYSGPFYLRDRVCGPNGAPPSWAMKYTLWLANYLDHEIGDNDLPLQPKGWSPWKFWQYSEKGLLDGIMNKEGTQLTGVDLNFFRGSLDDLYALAGARVPDDKVITEDEEEDHSTQPVEEEESTPKPPVNFIKHVVKAGDTLLGIALKYRTTVNAIMQVNPQITNPNIVRLGETLNIPK
jgi:lysozyme